MHSIVNIKKNNFKLCRFFFQFKFDDTDKRVACEGMFTDIHYIAIKY